MKIFYALWNDRDHRFGKPLSYDYTFTVRFPNIVFVANNIEEAKKRIKTLNTKLSKMERFNLSSSRIQRLAIS